MSACARYSVKNTEIDPALLECADEPAAPAMPVTNRQDVAYKNDLRFAHADCKSKLDRVREIQAEMQRTAFDLLLGQ